MWCAPLAEENIHAADPIATALTVALCGADACLSDLIRALTVCRKKRSRASPKTFPTMLFHHDNMDAGLICTK
jgi:hypothetical protein